MRARGLSPCFSRRTRSEASSDGGGAVDDAARVAGGVHMLDRLGLRIALRARADRASRPFGPSGRLRPCATKAGLSAASPSAVVSARGNSSRSSATVRRSRGRSRRRATWRSGPLRWRARRPCCDAARSASTLVAREALERGDEVGADALRHLENALAQVQVVAVLTAAVSAHRRRATCSRRRRRRTRSIAPEATPIGAEVDRLQARAAEAVERHSR